MFNSECAAGSYCSMGACQMDCSAELSCPGGQTCTSFGQCVASEDAGRDAGGAEADAGRDAGTDAGSDAGSDAGGDAGPSDAGPSDAGVITPTFVSVRGHAGLTVPAGAFVLIPYSGEVHDDGSEFDPASGRFTATHDGRYRVCASLIHPDPVSHTRFEIDIFIDGVRERAIRGGVDAVGGCRTVALSDGQTLDVRAWHPGSTSLTFTSNTLWDWLTIDEVWGGGSAVSVVESASFDAVSGVFAQVRYTTETLDAGAEWDPATSRFTATHAGDYEICASLGYMDPSIGFELDLYIDGARERAVGVAYGAGGGCRVVRLDAGSTVEVWLYQGLGTTVTFAGNPHWSWLTIEEQAPLGSAASLGNSTSVSVPNITFASVPYGTELYDDGSSFDDATSTFTVSSDGVYHVCASMLPRFPAGAYLELDVFLDGARERGLTYNLGATSGCVVDRFAAGDAIDLRVYQATGATQTASPDSFWNWLTIRRTR